mmetsp:Transcript_86308/g.252524  ORF Transcript_86308/g.252524 Transcript_86308/m.252524 type:complete len:371 (+) Transcript_86308:62-1174(+)
MRLRLRGPGGKNHTVNLADTASLAELRTEASQAFSIAEAELELLLGFPPAVCTAAADVPLSGLVKSGDSATVRQATGAPAKQASSSEAFAPTAAPAAVPAAAAPAPAAPASAAAAAAGKPAGGSAVSSLRSSEPWPCPACTFENLGQDQKCAMCDTPRPGAAAVGAGGASAGARGAGALSAQLVQMPDDNSCLFHGLVYLLDPAKQPSALRQMVATEVRSDPVRWDAATLGKPPQEYIDYILNPIRWGGQVELAILSSAYKAEVAVLEVQSGRCDVYGEGSAYSRRVYLLHSGIHFDAVSFGSLREVPPASFSDADAAARQLATERRSSGDFVDQDTMRLRCKICGFIAVGDYEARAHAGGTGHKEFAPA